ncbi:MAG: LysR family transcriptional regulator [Zoogloeaceae bacterium]|jgi:predicted thioesterase|nr:LysR family transcriptional regulator [Zoogloeaceae bacterium]
MSDTLKPGLTSTTRIQVDKARTIGFMGEELRVYSTPHMLWDAEMACRNLVLPHIGEGKDSVGTHAELDHISATPLGMWVEVTVTLAEVNGLAVTYEFSVRDEVEEVARGKHNRFIVGLEKTAQRLKAKQAKVAGG